MPMNDTLNAVNPLSDHSLTRMASLTDLSLDICDRLAAKQMAAMDLLVEHGNDILAHAVGAKDVETLVKGQLDAAQDLIRLIMAECRTSLVMASQANHEVQSWFKKNLTEVTSDLQKAVPAI